MKTLPTRTDNAPLQRLLATGSAEIREGPFDAAALGGICKRDWKGEKK